MCWWDMKGIICHEVLNQSETVNTEKILCLIGSTNTGIAEKAIHNLLIVQALSLNDDARPYTPRVTRQGLWFKSGLFLFTPLIVLYLLYFQIFPKILECTHRRSLNWSWEFLCIETLRIFINNFLTRQDYVIDKERKY